MAIIYSYPLNDDIKPLDELVGTTEKTINGKLKTVTRNFLLQDLAEFFIVDGGLQKTITLTTSSSSGPATLDDITGVLNIPDYSEAIPLMLGLEQVLSVGNEAENNITLLSTGIGSMTYGGFNTTYINSADRKTTLFYDDGTYGSSNLEFVLPSDKVDGRYTLATIDDIPAGSPITIINGSSLFSTGLTGTGTGSNATNSNFFGDGAGYEATDASYSNFFGINAGYEATDASSSNFFGNEAGREAINSNNSIFLGTSSGAYTSGVSYSILIGSDVGRADVEGSIGSNNIIIGQSISLPAETTNSMNIGGILFGKNTNDIASSVPSVTPSPTGKIGIGVVEPTNTLHIYSETEDTSGLRLERLTSSSPTTAGQAIGVDADGNVVTVEGGGGATNLSPSQTATNFTINSDTGTDATIPLGNGTLAGATLNDYTTAEKTKLSGIASGAEVNVNADWNAVSGDAQILNKPTIPSISGLATVTYVDTQDALKVDKVVGKGLSTEDYTTTEKNKLAGIAVGAEVNVNADWNATSGDAQILNKPTIPSITNLVPYTGATTDVNLGLNDITAAKLIKDGGFDYQFLKADGSVDNNTYLTSADLPSTLDLYATTSLDPVIAGYTALVRNITDARYNTTAVNVPTPTITGTSAAPTFCGAVISDPSILLGNPGVFNFSVIGKIRRIGGPTSSGADFFYSIYKRDLAGVEELIANSAPVVVPANGGIYIEYISIALWNNGIFLSTDRVVLKFYGIKTGGGSGAAYEFQFGGSDPVRGTAAISSAIIPNIYLKDLADVEKTPALNNEILYWNDPASLWEHELAENLVPLATATQKGLVSTTTQTFAGDKTFTGAIGASNLSGTNTGDNATNTQYSGLATSKQDTLQNTVNIKSINGNSILGSGDLTISSDNTVITGANSPVALADFTGSIVNTIVKSFPTPAGLFTSSKNSFWLRLSVIKWNGQGTCTIRVYFNTTESITNGSQVLLSTSIIPLGNTPANISKTIATLPFSPTNTAYVTNLVTANTFVDYATFTNANTSTVTFSSSSGFLMVAFQLSVAGERGLLSAFNFSKI